MVQINFSHLISGAKTFTKLTSKWSFSVSHVLMHNALYIPDLFCNFDFNATPLATIRTEAIIFQHQDNYTTLYSDHGNKGWYVGPCLHKYQNYKVYVTRTKGTQESNGVDFFPIKYKLPNTDTACRTNLLTILLMILNLIHLSTLLLWRWKNYLVLSLTKHLNATNQYAVSTRIKKNFNGTYYKGEITSDNEKWYKIWYDNCDQEKTTHTTATQIIAYSATSFTASYGAALLAIINDTKQKTNLAFKDLRDAQDLAFSICHPVTGKEMERRELVSNPLTSVDWIISTSKKLGWMAQRVGKHQW